MFFASTRPDLRHVTGPSRPCDRVFDLLSGSRQQMAAGLGDAFTKAVFTERERELAVEVLEDLANDIEVEVRRCLAEHIKSSPLLPRPVALRLAADVEAVAVPLLQSSPVYTDDDLVSIIVLSSPAKQRAIAGRRTLREPVSGALVETGDRSVIEILLANDGAEIPAWSYQALLDRYARDSMIQELLVERPVLPFKAKERLVFLLSGELLTRLIERHDIPVPIAAELSGHGRERALIQSIASLHGAQEVDAAAKCLHEKQALTPTLLLRALAAGEFEFFGAGMATLADLPAVKAQQALRKAGTPALTSLYERAQLPPQLQPAFQAVLEVMLERRRAGFTGTQPEVEMLIVETLARSYRRVSPDSLESVICQLGRLGAENPEGLIL